jgi:hypothetical protein
MTVSIRSDHARVAGRLYRAGYRIGELKLLQLDGLVVRMEG